MADERKWGKWDGPEQPDTNGGIGSGDPVTTTEATEAEGRGNKFVATCFNCGAHSYIGAEWKWFTCWKCGATSAEMIA